METTQQTLIQESAHLPFTTKQGDLPFWDHPQLKCEKVLPSKYYPSTNQEGVLELIKRRLIDSTDMTLLKVLGDSICSNENHLRRYMSSITSRSNTSERLDRYRKMGLVDRWKVRIRGQEEDNAIKPPAPFTLGIGGYKLLKHYYNGDFFMNPNRWDDLGIGGVKRYVAMNELRCHMTEKKICKKWRWNAIIDNNPHIKFPMAAAEIATENGNLNFLIDRIQMSQDFIGFFRSRLTQWKSLYEKYGAIPVSEFPNHISIVVIYAATLSLAEYAHKELLLDTYPFPIWICVEEDLNQDGISTAFYRPDGEKLKRMRVEF